MYFRALLTTDWWIPTKLALVSYAPKDNKYLRIFCVDVFVYISDLKFIGVQVTFIGRYDQPA
jgi:hypothetical protein